MYRGIESHFSLVITEWMLQYTKNADFHFYIGLCSGSSNGSLKLKRVNILSLTFVTSSLNKIKPFFFKLHLHDTLASYVSYLEKR